MTSTNDIPPSDPGVAHCGHVSSLEMDTTLVEYWYMTGVCVATLPGAVAVLGLVIAVPVT